jgi:hypothetical protein
VDADQFEKVFELQVAMCRTILVEKAREYADDTDRLRNFKIAAGLLETTPRAAVAGMLAKHIVSLYDLMLADICADTIKWDEKITDAMNYLILLRACTVEEIEQKVSSPDAS